MVYWGFEKYLEWLVFESGRGVGWINVDFIALLVFIVFILCVCYVLYRSLLFVDKVFVVGCLMFEVLWVRVVMILEFLFCVVFASFFEYKLIW